MSTSPEQLMAALQSRLYRAEQERDEWRLNAIELDKSAARERDRAEAAEKERDAARAEGEIVGQMKHITAEVMRGDVPLSESEELIADLRARVSHVEAERDQRRNAWAQSVRNEAALHREIESWREDRDQWEVRAEAAEQRAAELETAVLALADEWERLNAETILGAHVCIADLRALVSDPAALDRVRQEAVEAALAPIEAVLAQQEQWAQSAVLDISGRVGEERRTSLGAIAHRQCMNPDCLAEEGERHEPDCTPDPGHRGGVK